VTVVAVIDLNGPLVALRENATLAVATYHRAASTRLEVKPDPAFAMMTNCGRVRNLR